MGSARRFNLVRELGSGAFGTVYLAEMESLGGFRKEVALKLLRSEVGERSDAGQRLRDEARLLGRLRHRHIVQVDDLIRLDGRWAVVMEHVPGQDLEAVVSAADRLGEAIPPLAALEIGRGIALALDSAFNGAGSQGEPMRVVHRDIKPSNVRITPDGELKVLDFGIARADFGEREAKTGMVRYGSVAYMSPERLLGEPETTAGDVYALGCVVYELIVGRGLGRVELAPNRHLTQVSEAKARLVERMAGGEAAEIAEEVAELLAACLAYEVADRPTAAEVAERLRALGRKVHGTDLSTFSRQFLSRVREALGDDSRNVQGTLVEEVITGVTPVSAGTDAFSASVRGALDDNSTTDVAALLKASKPGTSAPTLVAPDEDAPPPAPIAAPENAPPTSSNRAPMFAIAAVFASLLVLVAYLLLRPEPQTAAVAPPVAPLPPAQIAPAVEPAPVAEPVAMVEPVEAPITPDAPVKPRGPVAPTTPIEAAPDPALTGPAPTEPAGPRLRAAKFTVTGAEMVSATCGDRSASGAGSALVRDFPTGSCAVKASIGGTDYRAELRLDTARGVECALEGETLQCR